MKKNFTFMMVFCFFAFSANTLFAQGSTTSGINGRVVAGATNEALPGATIVAIHQETGSQYACITGSDGFFRLPNMNVGGPYSINISFIGYHPFKKENIYLSLGQTFKLNPKLVEDVQKLLEVSVVAKKYKNDIFDGNRTGAQTVVDKEAISSMPSISGDLNDFTRLTPQANITGSGISIAGMNNRYNSLMIDGTVNNDVFGLAANGMNGGQTGISPISIEAVEQFQVVIAPYDVKQGGFVGGGINAVTKSGTNKVKGTAYFKFRNQNLAGKTPNVEEADREKLPEFTAKTYGVNVGGPIVKNKVFFFANAEFQKDQTPQPFSFADYTGNSSQTNLTDLTNKLINDYGYNPGGYLNNTRELNGQKFLVRFDINLNKNHKLMLRHQYTYGESLSPYASNSNNINFYNSGVFFPSTSNTTAIELKSRFGNDYSNDLKIGYTSVVDDRDPMGNKFPGIKIFDGDGEIAVGGEVYSSGNKLDQNILTLTDNFEIYKGRHTITIGTHNEYYDIYNLFMRRAFGDYEYNNVQDFIDGNDPTKYRIGYSLNDDIRGDGSNAAADFNFMQLGAYVQDEFQVNENLKVTGGLRIDVPIFTDDPKAIDGFNDTTIAKLSDVYDLSGAQAGEMPKTQFMFSPRVGFNWDVTGDQSTQVRGGLGIFTSRVPFVWPGGSYTNNGMMIGDYKQYSGNTFNPDWQTQYIPPVDPTATVGSGSQIDLYAENFNFPQMFRTNLAVDKKLPGDMIATFEVLYTKTLNNVLWKDVNVKEAWGTATGTPDNRPLYKTYKNGVEPNYGQIMLGDNTNEGYTYSITAKLQKRFKFGLDASIAYTYGHSKSIFDGTSSQNSSQWNYLVSSPVPRNEAELGISNFDMGSRVVGTVSYSKEFLNHLKTSVSLFYNGQSGQAISYIYNDSNGEFTNEAYGGPELIYIPKNSSDIIFGEWDGVKYSNTAIRDIDQTASWTELDGFINQNDYLSENRGEYAERNASRLPWVNIFDFHFSQDLFVNALNRRQTLQFTIDVFNIGNMINKDWGVRTYASNNNVKLMKWEGFDTDGTTPIFSFNRPKDDKPWFTDDSGLMSSRWQAQIGVRYIF
ncbi:MAG: TonB-dependent receptor [Bacteroidetes bacterium]|nr:TonB-dependent receptor [Bacteroidota bacterium]